MSQPTNNGRKSPILNSFCVDLEEWFHIGGLENPYRDISLWDEAAPFVEKDTGILLDMLAEHGHKATFLTVGWIAEKYPSLIRDIAAAGHEIGCHGYYHRMVWDQRPEEFRAEIIRARELLQKLSGQEVTTFRAPCFSITKECFWAFPILAEAGFRIDVSLVPAMRDNGGVPGFERDPFLLDMEGKELTVYPVSVMVLAGKATQFSGGGHLRALPLSLIERGFRQNHKTGRPVMAYIHPREVDPDHPRVKGIPVKKHIKAYMGLRGVKRKLRHLMRNYTFGTISEVLSEREKFPVFNLREGEILKAEGQQRAPSVNPRDKIAG